LCFPLFKAHSTQCKHFGDLKCENNDGKVKVTKGEQRQVCHDQEESTNASGGGTSFGESLTEAGSMLEERNDTDENAALR
jgi:hypothetical protein